MVDTRRPVPPRPPVRLRPAPPLDPPFVDESVPDLWPRPTPGQLTLDLPQVHRPGRGRPGSRSGPRPVPARPVAHPAPPVASPATATPEATRAAHRFVATCLEILNGYRPPGQIRPLTEPARATRVLEQLAVATARGGGPVRRRSARPTVRLRRMRVCQPRRAAVEVAAVLAGAAGRSWAMALRLERRRGTWICTALQVI